MLSLPSNQLRLRRTKIVMLYQDKIWVKKREIQPNLNPTLTTVISRTKARTKVVCQCVIILTWAQNQTRLKAVISSTITKIRQIPLRLQPFYVRALRYNPNHL